MDRSNGKTYKRATTEIRPLSEQEKYFSSTRSMIVVAIGSGNVGEGEHNAT